MAVTATWINAPSGTPTYDARALRLSDTLGLQGSNTTGYVRTGVKRTSGNDFQGFVIGDVVWCNPGTAVINVPSAWSGGYVVSNNAAINFNATRHATQTRIGTLYVQVWDTDVDGLGFRKVEILYNQGTPAGSPVPPSIPSLAMRIADITVPPTGGGALSVDDKREWLTSVGGVKYSASGWPIENVAGQLWYEASTNRWLGSDGTTHYALLDPSPAWTTLPGGNFTGNWGSYPQTPSAVIQYRIERGRVHLRGRLCRDNGSVLIGAGSFNPTFTLPGSVTPGREVMLSVPTSAGVGRIEFVPSSTVILYNPGPAALWVDLSGCSYDIAA